ncbi:hypothetical protein B0H19DRAFT_1246176 [Mycena capillaripes]|nr:hypothetical protein B0H19DRAFT_1246176 [Mycena capillaripes]
MLIDSGLRGLKLSLAGAQTNIKRIPTHRLSYNTADVPPELWALIVSFASRQSLARLCSVSHRFCSAFSTLLYANTVDHPLTASQSARLIETLSDDKTSLKLHPATLIRDLGLTSTDGAGTRVFLGETRLLIKALKNLELTPLSTSGLRALHWSLGAGVDELGRILGAPGNFPHLRELIVSSDGSNHNFNFVQIPELEVLGLEINFKSLIENFNYHTWDDTGDKLCFKLAGAMQMLPCSSPLLHTLKFKLIIPFDDDAFPHSGYSDLFDAINAIHLPLLATLDLHVDLSLFPNGINTSGFGFPSTDFSVFLGSHPNLLDVNLSAPETKLTEKPAFLPGLRSFQGSFRHAVSICACPRQLQKLVLEFVHPSVCTLSPLPSFSVLPLASCLSLTHLRVFAVDAVGSTMKTTNQLSPTPFRNLVSSFPNLTHLDVCINQRMTEYCGTLILLTKLQTLRLQEYRTRQLGPSHWPARLVFPPSDYILEFALFLPCMPQLAFIEIDLLADTYVDSEEFGFSRMCAQPEMRAEYDFSVIRSVNGDDVYVVLDRARVVDSYSSKLDR